MKRKIISLIMVLALTLCAFPAVAFAENSENNIMHSNEIRHITGIGVNFRTGPGTNYSIKGCVYRPDSFEVLGTSNSWYRAKMRDGGFKDSIGYVSSSYTASGISCDKWFVSASRANFRSGPGLNYSSYGEVDNKDKFYVIDNPYNSSEQKTWYKVHMTSGEYAGREGYLRSDVVSYGSIL